MLRKIISIRNVGRFAIYQYQGDVELRKLNIIYADNGQGKTTLAAILRSLKLGDGSLIEGRRTLGTSGEPRVQLLLDDNSIVSFQNGRWDNQIMHLEVFDEVFIAENVYSGNQVGHDHKRNLYRFVIGSRGVELAQKVDSLDEASRAKAGEIREKERELTRYISGPIGVSDFVELEPPPEGAIAAREREIVALETAGEIAAKSALEQIHLPEIPLTELKELLAASVRSVSREAAQRVQEHIAHCMDKYGESWIESGLGYMGDSSCPFCGQSLTGNELVEAYQAYFDAAYQDFKKQIDEFSERIRQLLSENAILVVRGQIASNDELTEFWKGQVDAQYPEVEFETMIQQPWQNLRDSLTSVLDQKAAAPLDELEPSEALRIAVEAYDSCSRAAVANYNQALDKTNELIETRKRETEEGDLAQAREELENLKNQQVRHKPEVNVLCQEYMQLCVEKQTLEIQKVQAKVDLDKYANDILEAYGPCLNEHLAKCGTEFRIIDLNRNYIGGSPRTDYCLQIDGKSVDLGGADTPVEKPSFKNTLSSGDKSALAFSFFIARLRQDPDIGERIVVVDDPASSLDAQRRIYTCHQIGWLSTHCKQVIVLTHSASLARQVWDNAKSATPKTLEIKREGNYSVIENLDIEERTRGEYFKNYFEISEYLETGPKDDGHTRAIARCIRPMLEGYLRVRFPREFKAGEWLGDFIGKLSVAEEGHPLYSLKPQLEELSEINDYSSKYHHDQNPNADSEPINDVELSSWAKRALCFIG